MGLVIFIESISFGVIRMKKIVSSLFLLILFVGLVMPLGAQTVPLGMPFFDDGIRRAQLMGKIDSTASLMIRPVHPQRALKMRSTWDRDTVLYPSDTNVYGKYTKWTDAKQHFRVELLPVYIHLRNNGHHPYG